MVARTLFILVSNAVFLIAVVWLVPIEGFLSARGYSSAQIAAMQAAIKPSDGAPHAVTREPETTGRTANGGDGAPSSRPAQGEPRARQAEQAAIPAKPEPQRLVATDRINVRAGAATSEPVIAQVRQGDSVVVIDDPGGDWVRIRHGEMRGWVYRPLFRRADGS